MNKLFYFTNIEIPYRNEFFNILSKKYELTVVYERKKSKNRDTNWSKSVKGNYKIDYLNGLNYNDEFSFDVRILKYIKDKKSKYIFGCYNSLSQILLMIIMKIFKRNFYINLDGKQFYGNNIIKKFFKLFVLNLASGFIVAGESTKLELEKNIKNKKIFVYHFSSLKKEELESNKIDYLREREDYFIIVGQYLGVKGIDLAIELAANNSKYKFKFIGSGKKANLLIEKTKKYSNIEIIPFLNKNELSNEYKKCRALIFPSIQECWGLVVNEAASYGTPIIGTNGSGAAIEILSGKYDNLLAQSGSYEDLNDKFNFFLKMSENELTKYKRYLVKKNYDYCIENNAIEHIELLEDGE